MLLKASDTEKCRLMREIINGNLVYIDQEDKRNETQVNSNDI